MFSIIGVKAQQVFEERAGSLDTSYLESRNELDDYILDTGDELNIEFIGIPELSDIYRINEQGEIYFKRIKYTYVRGLTIRELAQLLEDRYKEYLVKPEIYIRIKTYKSIRVFVTGEVRAPGVIKLPAYVSTNFSTSLSVLDRKKSSFDSDIYFGTSDINPLSTLLSNNENETRNSSINSKSSIKRHNDYLTTLSNAIQKAGGLTSYSDISKLELIRDIPIGKGGGKKRAIINFLSYIKNADSSSDVRLFDGDSIFIPRLKEKDLTIIPQSILSGLSPRFITVSIAGRIENPGLVRIPLEGTLSDAMNLTGPRKPLSGKIYLTRYTKDGTLVRKNIKYSSSANPGSPGNPYLLAGDSITIRNSLLGRTSGTLRAITEPFVGIYTTKELIQNIAGE